MPITSGQVAYEAFMAHRDCPHAPAPWASMAEPRQRQWEAAAQAVVAAHKHENMGEDAWHLAHPDHLPLHADGAVCFLRSCAVPHEPYRRS